MVLKNNINNRLLIYFFYDKDGIVDDYITYMLKHMKPFVKDIVFVSNGDLTEDSKEKVKPLCDHIIERENKGMDVMAYKAAIDYKGWDRLAEYDEMIMMNFTIMGPVSSFDEMFSDMDKRDVDFWGLTIFHGCDGDPFGCNCEYGYLPLHIQSHFIAVRNEMIKSDDYHRYWDERPEIKYYSDAVGKHEAIFTKKFADMGYKWDVYSDTRDDMNYTDLPIISMPVELIRDKKCQIFKRRNFFQEYFDILNKSTGEVEYELYEYLKENTDYDVDMIWQNMLRVQNMADIKKALQLNYVLSSKAVENPLFDIKSKKIAFIVTITDNAGFLNYSDAMKNFIEKYDVYFAVESEEKKDIVKQVFDKACDDKIIAVSEIAAKRGLVYNHLKDTMKEYEYVCFLNDCVDKNTTFGSAAKSFSYRCFENLIKNEIYVNNVLSLFEEEKRLGLLCPPVPNHADYYPTLGCYDWGNDLNATKALAKDMGLTVNIHWDKEPVAPFGNMFWARTSALNNMFAYEWQTYERNDDSEEDTKDKKSHKKEEVTEPGQESADSVIEKILPFAVQQSGYYCAYVMSDIFARLETNNLEYMVSQVNKQAFAMFGIDSHFNFVNKMREFHAVYGECDPASIEIRLIRIIRKLIPKGLKSFIGKVIRKIIGIFRRR